jgi:hypothetical protein
MAELIKRIDSLNREPARPPAPDTDIRWFLSPWSSTDMTLYSGSKFTQNQSEARTGSGKK